MSAWTRIRLRRAIGEQFQEAFAAHEHVGPGGRLPRGLGDIAGPSPARSRRSRRRWLKTPSPAAEGAVVGRLDCHGFLVGFIATAKSPSVPRHSPAMLTRNTATGSRSPIRPATAPRTRLASSPASAFFSCGRKRGKNAFGGGAVRCRMPQNLRAQPAEILRGLAGTRGMGVPLAGGQLGQLARMSQQHHGLKGSWGNRFTTKPHALPTSIELLVAQGEMPSSGPRADVARHEDRAPSLGRRRPRRARNAGRRAGPACSRGERCPWCPGSTVRLRSPAAD